MALLRIKWDDSHKALEIAPGTLHVQEVSVIISHSSCPAPACPGILDTFSLHSAFGACTLKHRLTPPHRPKEGKPCSLLHGNMWQDCEHAAVLWSCCGVYTRAANLPELKWAPMMRDTFHDTMRAACICFLFPRGFLFSKILVQVRPPYNKKISRASYSLFLNVIRSDQSPIKIPRIGQYLEMHSHQHNLWKQLSD